MKRILAAIVAVVALFTISAAPAHAVEPLPAELSGTRFWSGSICVDGSAIDGQYYRVGYMAQQWNLRVNNTSVLALDYEDDCAAAGYPPSRRFVMGIYNNPSDPDCVTMTNVQATFYNSMWRWTNGPGIYINVGQSTCVSGQQRRDHIVAASIGKVLGFDFLNSSGYNSRVMNMTVYSWDNIAVPSTAEGALAYNLYTGLYGG